MATTVLVDFYRSRQDDSFGPLAVVVPGGELKAAETFGEAPVGELREFVAEARDSYVRAEDGPFASWTWDSAFRRMGQWGISGIRHYMIPVDLDLDEDDLDLDALFEHYVTMAKEDRWAPEAAA